jgi:hypothetical protein
MSNIDSYKKRFYGLMESTMGDVRPILTEVVNIEGRNTNINDDGTITIVDKNGNKQKIRMSLTTFGDINVVNIQPANGGYNITGKSGMTQFVDNNKISQVIQFVDTNSPSEIKSGSWSTPNLKLRKELI